MERESGMQIENKLLLIRSEVIEFATLPIVLKISPKQLLKALSPFMVASSSTINLEKVTQILTHLIPNFNEKDVHVLFLLYKIVVEGEDIEILQKTIKKADWSFNLVNSRKFCLFMFLQSFRTNLDTRDALGSGSGYHTQFNESIRSNNRNAR